MGAAARQLELDRIEKYQETKDPADANPVLRSRWAWLYKQARRTGGPVDVDDLVQEASLALWDAASRFIPGDVLFTTYATSAVRRKMWRLNKYERRAKRIATVSLDQEPPEGQHPLHERIPDGRPDPELQVTAAELLELLTDRERFVILKRYKEGWHLREVGWELGVSHSTVANIQKRALVKLRRYTS